MLGRDLYQTFSNQQEREETLCGNRNFDLDTSHGASFVKKLEGIEIKYDAIYMTLDHHPELCIQWVH